MDLELMNGGPGPLIRQAVDQNHQAHVFAVQQTIIQDAVRKGNGYNINTGTIGLTSNTASAVMYFKNNEAPINGETGIWIDAIAFGQGIGDVGLTKDEKTIIQTIRNPTAGSIITNAVVVDMNENRNHSSDNSLADSLAYKGVEGDSFTDGDASAQFYSSNVRDYFTVDFYLKKGKSIGITINTNTSVGTIDIYCALIMHREDGKNIIALSS